MSLAMFRHLDCNRLKNKLETKEQQAQGGRKNVPENETASPELGVFLAECLFFKLKYASTVRFMLLRLGQMSN